MKTQFLALFISIAFAAAGAGSLPAFGQESGRQPDPGDSRTPTVADKPDSAFNGYKSFREQPVRPWKDANQEVADNPGMGSMANMPGMNMPGMDSKGGAAANGRAGGAMPEMGDMPGMSMGRKEPKGAAAATGQGIAKPEKGGMVGMAMPGMSQQASKMNMAGAQQHDAHDGNAKAGGGMPGMSMKDGHLPQGKAGAMPGMAMPGMDKSGDPEMARLTGTGVVRDVDKAGGRIRLTHDPIAAVNWPQMTIVFRVKNASLVDQVKQGDKVEFVLSRSSTGFVISDIQNTAKRGPNQSK